MTELTYYDILGIPQDATQLEIKHAYYKLAKQMHPDMGGSSHGMRLLNRAYKILREPESRRDYDQTLKSPTPQEQAKYPHEPNANELLTQEKLLVSRVKKAGAKTLFSGVGIFLLGAIITAVSYNAATEGSHYIFFWGAIVWGGLLILRGWYTLLNPYEALHKALDTPDSKYVFFLEKTNRKPRAIAIILVSCVIALFGVAGLSSSSSYDSTPTTQPSSLNLPSPSSAPNNFESEYNDCVDEYKSIESDLNGINSQMDTYDRLNNTYLYNSLVPEQNDLVQQARDKYDECEAKRQAYNNSL